MEITNTIVELQQKWNIVGVVDPNRIRGVGIDTVLDQKQIDISRH